MEASVFGFQADIRFHFLKNYLLSRRFSSPEKGLAKQVLDDFVSPPSPQDLLGMGDGSQLHIGRRDR